VKANKDDIHARRGEQAQELLNLFQRILDYPDLGGRVRNRLVRSLINLSMNSKVFPESLGSLGDINTDKIKDKNGSQTSHSIVYRYEPGNQKFAIKIIRVLSDDYMNGEELRRKLEKDDRVRLRHLQVI
jgi:hypothetical protein